MNAFRREHLSRFPFDPRIRRSGYKRAGGCLRTRVLKLFAVVIFGGILLLLIQHGGPQRNKLADPGGSLTPTAALSTFLMLAILGVTAAMVYSLIKPSTKSPPEVQPPLAWAAKSRADVNPHEGFRWLFTVAIRVVCVVVLILLFGIVAFRGIF